MLAVVVRLVMQWRGADPHAPLAVGADQGALWAAIIGTVLIIAAMITGFSTWSPSAMLVLAFTDRSAPADDAGRRAEAR